MYTIEAGISINSHYWGRKNPMNPTRSCPICPNCGSKKFQRLKSNQTRVQCTNCKKILEI